MIYKIDITELWNHNFDKINSPDGYQKINTLVKKPKKKCYAVMFYSNKIIECSEDHMFQLSDLSWVKSKDLIYGMEILTEYGTDKYIDRVDIGINDVYDLEVDHENHRYYSEGISSHNTGKTSTATALIKSIGGEAHFINASLDKGIDVLRTQISNFASTESFDGKIKIVVLDECLEENEEVILGTLTSQVHTKLNSMEKGKIYTCISYNLDKQIYENDTCEIISDKEDDIYEVELEDGSTIKVTKNHPFIINNNEEKSIQDGLKVGDDVVIFKGK